MMCPKTGNEHWFQNCLSTPNISAHPSRDSCWSLSITMMYQECVKIQYNFVHIQKTRLVLNTCKFICSAWKPEPWLFSNILFCIQHLPGILFFLLFSQIFPTSFSKQTKENGRIYQKNMKTSNHIMKLNKMRVYSAPDRFIEAMLKFIQLRFI